VRFGLPCDAPPDERDAAPVGEEHRPPERRGGRRRRSVPAPPIEYQPPPWEDFEFPAIACPSDQPVILRYRNEFDFDAAVDALLNE
jgi:hypothetical protein